MARRFGPPFLRRRSVVLAAVVLGALSACSAHGSAEEGGGAPGFAVAVVSTSSTAEPLPPTRIVTLRTADGSRSARIHHPASAGPGAPLIVMVHPAATSALDAESFYGWDTIADRFGAVVAYPDGLLDSFQNTWNAGSCCPPATQLGTDDVGFVDQLATALQTTDAVGSELYAVGFSNGAMLAYAWACAKPHRLTGVGVVAGALTSSCDGLGPTTLVAVHGSADPSVPMTGGPGPDGSTFPSLDGSLAPFLTAASCPADPQRTALGRVEVATWSCAGGMRVVRDVVDGLDHAWPGAGPTAGTTESPDDATGFIWAQLHAG